MTVAGDERFDQGEEYLVNPANPMNRSIVPGPRLCYPQDEL
jgi:hypothetical protein